MPVTLNHKRGETQVVQQVDFGTGDILIMPAKASIDAYQNEVWLIQNKPKPKSEWQTVKDPDYPENTNTDALPIRDTIALVFHDRDSIASLMDVLQKVYDDMPPSCGGDCGMNYCDDNGCIERKRNLVNETPMASNV